MSESVARLPIGASVAVTITGTIEGDWATRYLRVDGTPPGAAPVTVPASVLELGVVQRVRYIGSRPQDGGYDDDGSA